MTLVRATVANMERAPDGTIAYSPRTGEEYSATPGDYWDAPQDYCLRDSEGQDMILIQKVTYYVGVTLTEV